MSSEYTMLFHDDDMLLQGSLSLIMSEIVNRPELVAVSGNAYIIKDQLKTNDLFNPYLKEKLIIKNEIEMALHYLQTTKGHTPFPNYIYRTSVLKTLSINSREGKKHADVSFLTHIAEKGPILWIPQPTMYYRRHGQNDSHNIDPAAILSLMHFFSKYSKVPPALIKEYKMKHYFLWIFRSKIENIIIWHWRSIIFFKSSVVYILLNPHLILQKMLREFRRSWKK
jgi:hypothetical protein